MSFDTVYENIDSLFDSYVKEHHLIQTPFTTQMADGTYLSILNDDGYHKRWLNHDLILFLQHFLATTPEVAKNIKETLMALGSAFKSHVDLNDYSQSPYHIMSVREGVSVVGHRYIVLTFQQSDLIIHLSKLPSGLELVQFHDMSDIVDNMPVKVVNDDLNASLNAAIENFKNKMMVVAGNQVAHFDKQFVDDLSNASLEDIINLRLKEQHAITEFRYRDKINLVNELHEEKEKYPNFEFGMRSNTLTFFENDIMFFMKTMKTMLSSQLYDNFLKAINFYHNYKQLMNQDYQIQFHFYIKHKLQDLDSVLFKISFGNDFELTFGPLNDSSNPHYKRTSLFEVHTRSKRTGNKEHVLRTSDFSDFYQHVFDIYSLNITSILNKPMLELTWDDVTVLNMYHFK